MDAAAELGKNLVISKHQIQPEYGDEQADAGRDCRTRLSRDQILRRERGQGNINFPCSADHVQDWQHYPVDPRSCYMCDNTTYGGGGSTMQCIFCYCHECVVCVVCCHLIYSGRRTCGRTSRGHTGGRAHRISPPSCCGACLNFNREKDPAIPFFPSSTVKYIEFGVPTN